MSRTSSPAGGPAWWRGFLSTLTLVSRIPVRARFDPDFSWSALFLPLVGIFAAAAAGAGLLLGWTLFRDWFLATLLGLVLQYALFNLFHLDGLLDSADALLCFADREKRLAILKDSRIGSFAFAVGLAAMAAKLYLVYACASDLGGLALVSARGFSFFAAFLMYPVAGRASAALVPLFLEPARKDGLGASVADRHLWRYIAGFILALVLASLPLVFARYPDPLLPEHWPLFAAAPFAIAASLVLVALPYRNKVGGYTGDTLGAAVEVGEAAFLLAFFAALQHLASK